MLKRCCGVASKQYCSNIPLSYRDYVVIGGAYLADNEEWCYEFLLFASYYFLAIQLTS